jgi:ABC-type uncharacterized transport system ATPase subunit
VLDLGKVIATDTPDVVKSDPEVVRAYLGTTHAQPDSEPTPTEVPL